MRRAWKVVAVLVTATALSVLGVQRCASSFWETTLWGPYTGTAYTQPIRTKPASILPVPGVGQLEVHEVEGETVPVLALRTSDQKIQWAQLLRPERRSDDGTLTTAFIRDLRLRKIQRDSNGYRVSLTCFWEWGGREGGLIFLNPDHSFRAISLSW
ncbi:MAG: hypothetical protein ACO1QR_11835 [Chthoniobacteraceae bacterium]